MNEQNESKPKITPGDWYRVADIDDPEDFGISDGEHRDSVVSVSVPWPHLGKNRITTEVICRMDEGFTEVNSKFIAEAGTVANETGLMPRQMARELDIARVALAEIAQEASDYADGVEDAHPLAQMANRIQGRATDATPRRYVDLAGENKTLRDALQAVEWSGTNPSNSFDYPCCPRCFGVWPEADNTDCLKPYQVGHAQDCQLAAALSAREVSK